MILVVSILKRLWLTRTKVQKMTIQSTQAEINRSLSTKTVDKFYVSFYEMDNNVSNILGREVQSVERPTITFNEFEIRNKGIKQMAEARLEYQSITINFFDDSSSISS